MLVTQDKSYRSPLLVDRDFLRALDKRLNELISCFIDDLAKKHGISRMALDEAIAAHPLEHGDPLRPVVQSAMYIAEIRYAVQWENDAEADKLSLDDLIEMLDFEVSRPKSIKAETGPYADEKVKVALGSRYSQKIEVTFRTDHERRAQCLQVIDNLMSQYGPKSAYLHTKIFRNFVTGAIGVFSLIMIVSVLSNLLVEVNNVFSFFSSIIIVFGSAFAGRQYAVVYPLIEFAFGRHRNHTDMQKLGGWILATLLLPVFLAYLVEAFPLEKATLKSSPTSNSNNKN
jgi:hypothetical protein